MAEQPSHQMGRYTIQGQPGNGAFAPAYLAMEGRSNDTLPTSSTSIPVYEFYLPEKDDGFCHFINLLEDLKYDITPKKKKISPLSGELILGYTEVSNGSDHRVLIYFDERTLIKPSAMDITAVMSISSFFDEDKDRHVIIIVFSKTSLTPVRAIRGILANVWSKTVKKGVYGPWSDVDSLIKRYKQIKKIQNGVEKEERLEGLKLDVALLLEEMPGKRG